MNYEIITTCMTSA